MSTACHNHQHTSNPLFNHLQVTPMFAPGSQAKGEQDRIQPVAQGEVSLPPHPPATTTAGASEVCMASCEATSPRTHPTHVKCAAVARAFQAASSHVAATRAAPTPTAASAQQVLLFPLTGCAPPPPFSPFGFKTLFPRPLYVSNQGMISMLR